MALAPAVTSQDDYTDDFTDDGSDLPLPGLNAQPLTGHWPLEEGWQLPGTMEQQWGGHSSNGAPVDNDCVTGGSSGRSGRGSSSSGGVGVETSRSLQLAATNTAATATASPSRSTSGSSAATQARNTWIAHGSHVPHGRGFAAPAASPPSSGRGLAQSPFMRPAAPQLPDVTTGQGVPSAPQQASITSTSTTSSPLASVSLQQRDREPWAGQQQPAAQRQQHQLQLQPRQPPEPPPQHQRSGRSLVVHVPAHTPQQPQQPLLPGHLVSPRRQQHQPHRALLSPSNRQQQQHQHQQQQLMQQQPTQQSQQQQQQQLRSPTEQQHHHHQHQQHQHQQHQHQHQQQQPQSQQQPAGGGVRTSSFVSRLLGARRFQQQQQQQQGQPQQHDQQRQEEEQEDGEVMASIGFSRAGGAGGEHAGTGWAHPSGGDRYPRSVSSSSMSSSSSVSDSSHDSNPVAAASSSSAHHALPYSYGVGSGLSPLQLLQQQQQQRHSQPPPYGGTMYDNSQYEHDFGGYGGAGLDRGLGLDPGTRLNRGDEYGGQRMDFNGGHGGAGARNGYSLWPGPPPSMGGRTPSPPRRGRPLSDSGSSSSGDSDGDSLSRSSSWGEGVIGALRAARDAGGGIDGLGGDGGASIGFGVPLLVQPSAAGVQFGGRLLAGPGGMGSAPGAGGGGGAGGPGGGSTLRIITGAEAAAVLAATMLDPAWRTAPGGLVHHQPQLALPRRHVQGQGQMPGGGGWGGGSGGGGGGSGEGIGGVEARSSNSFLPGISTSQRQLRGIVTDASWDERTHGGIGAGALTGLGLGPGHAPGPGGSNTGGTYGPRVGGGMGSLAGARSGPAVYVLGNGGGSSDGLTSPQGIGGIGGGLGLHRGGGIGAAGGAGGGPGGAACLTAEPAPPYDRRRTTQLTSATRRSHPPPLSFPSSSLLDRHLVPRSLSPGSVPISSGGTDTSGALGGPGGLVGLGSAGLGALGLGAASLGGRFGLGALGSLGGLGAGDSVGPGGGGLPGVLTSHQIQEWMSQHASRLLLPRHMHDIADIVFRPPSAVPEKKSPKCRPGSAPETSVLSPPAVLGGRYPPLPVSRLMADEGFMAGLLMGLPGVDPSNSRVQTIITALQGRDVMIRGEEEGEGMTPPQGPATAAAASKSATLGLGSITPGMPSPGASAAAVHGLAGAAGGSAQGWP